MATTLPSLPPLTGDTSWIDNPTGMEGLPTPIAPARPSTTTTSTGSGRAASLGIDPSGNPNVAAVPSLIPSGTGIFAQFTTWIGAHVEDFVFIIIGVLLIGAGALALGFQGVESAVGSVSSGAARVTKTAAKVAELAP